MKETAVEWLYNNLKSHFEHNGELLEVVQMSFEQAKEMEKEQMISAINDVSENNVKYANMIIASWSQIEKGDLFINNTKLAEQYYNETYEKKKD